MTAPDASPTGALIVGLATAAASVVVAMVSRRAASKGVRDNLKADVELAKELRDGSREKRIVEQLISESILAIALFGAQTPLMMRAMIWLLAIALGFFVAAIILTLRIVHASPVLLVCVLFGVAIVSIALMPLLNKLTLAQAKLRLEQIDEKSPAHDNPPKHARHLPVVELGGRADTNAGDV